jgi:hypothetical protein
MQLKQISIALEEYETKSFHRVANPTAYISEI